MNDTQKDPGREVAPTDTGQAVAGFSTELLAGQGMPPGMALWFNDALFERAKEIARYLSKAEGFVPRHLLGKVESCFAVVERSLTWNLSPYAVAGSTYQTPDGKVGYEGKLCQAILENSGQLIGPVRYSHYVKVKVKMPGGGERSFKSNDPALGDILESGAEEISRADWSNVQGKFEIATSQKQKQYPKRLWDSKDAEGLGVTVFAEIRGEPEPREWDFDLIQAFPLNSTLWATDPRSQICYSAVRRFGNLAAPGIFMGVPFRGDQDPADYAQDVTPPQPRPQRGDFGAHDTGQADRDAAADRERGQAAGMAVDADGRPAVTEDVEGENAEIDPDQQHAYNEVMAALAEVDTVQATRQVLKSNAETIKGLTAEQQESVETFAEARFDAIQNPGGAEGDKQGGLKV